MDCIEPICKRDLTKINQWSQTGFHSCVGDRKFTSIKISQKDDLMQDLYGKLLA